MVCCDCGSAIHRIFTPDSSRCSSRAAASNRSSGEPWPTTRSTPARLRPSSNSSTRSLVAGQRHWRDSALRMRSSASGRSATRSIWKPQPRVRSRSSPAAPDHRHSSCLHRIWFAAISRPDYSLAERATATSAASPTSPLFWEPTVSLPQRSMALTA